MARTRQIIMGLNNSQKFRFILTAQSGEDVGLTLTIQQMSDQFATTKARVAVWDALLRLSHERYEAARQGKPLPLGLVTQADGFRQVQVDLH